MGQDDSEPHWKRENDQLRREMGIPEYEPPRFQDGTYTYEVTRVLESRYDCTIQFRGKNVRYNDPWEVLVDREQVMNIARKRDQDGNTVYLMDSGDFLRRIRETVKSDDE